MNTPDSSCSLAAAVGRRERCPGRLCSFWEVAPGPRSSEGCALHAVAPYLKTRPELARHLLKLRRELDELGDDVPG